MPLVPVDRRRFHYDVGGCRYACKATAELVAQALGVDARPVLNVRRP